jgi:hypothetical protein
MQHMIGLYVLAEINLIKELKCEYKFLKYPKKIAYTP